MLSSDQYDAWGNLLSGGDPTDPCGYRAQVGYYTDHETALILCGHRYYDPVAGRWLTRDPIGYAGGLNLYGYCGGDAVGEVDPSGYMDFSWQAGVGAVGGSLVVAGCIAFPPAGVALAIIGGTTAVISFADNMSHRGWMWCNVGGALDDTFLKPLEDPYAFGFSFGAAAMGGYSGVKSYAAGKGTPSAGDVARLPQDIDVNPGAPQAKGSGKIGRTPSQNAAVDQMVRDLNNTPNVNDIRLNQQQVNVNGDRVGINRPDLQYTQNG